MNYESNKVTPPFSSPQGKKDPQQVPSSFQTNPQYFNRRLVRIKRKIDELIKQHVQPSSQSVKMEIKQEFLDDENRTSYQTVQTNHTSYGRVRQAIGVEKIVGETRVKIQAIYNEIHLLQQISVRDENTVNTNTFELRCFLKDLRNQNKRLNRLMPEKVLFQMQKEKKEQFKKSQIVLKQKQDHQTQVMKQDKQQDMQDAKLMIENELSKRRIFNDTQRYYYDQKVDINDVKCNPFGCQII